MPKQSPKSGIQWHNLPEPQEPEPGPADPPPTGAFKHPHLRQRGFPVVPPARVLAQEMGELWQKYRREKIRPGKIKTPSGIVLPGPAWARVFPELLDEEPPPLASYFLHRVRAASSADGGCSLYLAASGVVRWLALVVLLVLWVADVVKLDTAAGVVVVLLLLAPTFVHVLLLLRRNRTWPRTPKDLLKGINGQKLPDLLTAGMTARDILLAMVAIEHDPKCIKTSSVWKPIVIAGGIIAFVVLLALLDTLSLLGLIFLLLYSDFYTFFKSGAPFRGSQNRKFHFSFSETDPEVYTLGTTIRQELYLNLHEFPAAIGIFRNMVLSTISLTDQHGLAQMRQVIEEMELRQAVAEFEFFYKRRMNKLRKAAGDDVGD